MADGTTPVNEPAHVPPGAKKLDYWWTVLFTDPLAIPLTRFLARTKLLTANQVSVVALVLGYGVGGIFALGTRIALIAGAVVFYLAFVADCVDGKLARATGTTGPRGEGFDKLSDGARRASGSLGLALWLWRAEVPGDDSLWWGGDGVPRSSFIFAIVYAIAAYYFLEVSGASTARREAWFIDGESGATANTKWGRALARRRLLATPGMPDVQAVVFILGPLTGLVVPALVAGTVMVTAGIVINARRRLRA